MKEKYSILRSADRYIEQRQYKKAIKIYTSLIDSGENDAPLINSLGDLQYRDGDRTAALKSYSKAAKLFSDTGDSLKAAGLCRKILKIDSADDDSLELFLELNSKRDALFDSIGLLNELVRESMEKPDLQRAFRLQKRLVGIDPENGPARLLMAELQFLEGKKESAAESVYRAVSLMDARSRESDGWGKVNELVAARQSGKEFQQFIEKLREGYAPSSPDVSGEQGVGVTMDIPETPTPVAAEAPDKTLASSDFFEVEGSIGGEEEIELEVEEDSDISFDIPAEGLEVTPPPPPGEFPEIPGEEEEEEEVAETEIVEELQLDLEGREETDVSSLEDDDSREFELNLDEDELAESPEEFLELMEAEALAQVLPDEETEESVEEPAPDYAPDEEEMEGEFAVGESPEEPRQSYEWESVEPEEAEIPEEPEAPDLTDEFEVPEPDDAPEEFVPEELDLEITASSEPEIPESIAGPGAEDEIESALEGIFVSGEAGDQPVPPDIPGTVMEKEYIGTDRSEPVPRGESPENPDANPDIQLELGIAYRDMALLEDAVVKYARALEMFEEKGDKDKCVRCCQLLAEGCNVLEQFEETLRWVNRGLDYHDLTGDEIVSFEYESAVALEALGDFSESLKSYRRIQSIHPGFRDVENRISAMESAGH